MAQRYQSVSVVISDGVEVTEVASRFGVSRQTLHRRLARYERCGLAALADRSHAVKDCPHQMAPESEAMVLEVDIVGVVLLADGSTLKVLTGVDDNSRFCVCVA